MGDGLAFATTCLCSVIPKTIARTIAKEIPMAIKSITVRFRRRNGLWLGSVDMVHSFRSKRWDWLQHIWPYAYADGRNRPNNKSPIDRDSCGHLEANPGQADLEAELLRHRA